jgi:hypothetical protein
MQEEKKGAPVAFAGTSNTAASGSKASTASSTTGNHPATAANPEKTAF